MNLVLFFLTIIVSFIIVRIGAIAFELTGLEWSLAKFQALSCFSGTGFTTKEAELVVGHPQRRKVASVLMVLGNAGFVTLIATFANTIRPQVTDGKWASFFSLEVPPRALPWINLLLLIIVGCLIYRVLSHTKVLRVITTVLRNRVMKSDVAQTVSFEQLMVATGGYGVAAVTVDTKSELANRVLRESGLREKDITVLAFEREGITTANPSANTRILPDDRLICFGKTDMIRRELGGISG